MPRFVLGMTRLFLTSSLVAVCATAHVRAEVPLPPAFATEDLDVAACAAGVPGKLEPVALPTLVSVLGLYEKADGAWRGGQWDNKVRLSTVQYRLAFKKPVTIGSLLLFGPAREAAVLKPDSPYPGDPDRPEQWEPLEIAARQSGGATGTLAKPLAVRAVLITDRVSKNRSELKAIRIWADRLHNVTPAARAYAEREYNKPSGNFSAPFLYSAARVTSSRAPWISAGPDSSGKINVAPISDVAPTWFMLTWDEPQTLRGLWIDGNLRQYELDVFTGPSGVNPRTGTAAEWRPLPSVKRLDRNGTWIEFDPTTTRGIRWRITRTEDSSVAEIRGLHALTSLGHDPIPPAPRRSTTGDDGEAVSPKQIAIEMPYEGKLTVVVDGPDGRRVKNVVGRASVAAGPQAIGWNLQDEDGRYVAPGKYRWKAISHPPLEVKYEQTVYPNVSAFAPDNAPWLTSKDGPDGWMADHTAPICGCALGDRMFLGAVTAESGVSLIECDLDGRKQWGHHSFAAWTGPRFLAGDRETLFVGARMNNNTTDVVWSVDTQTKKVSSLLNLAPSGLSKRGLRGMAARDGKLALSVQGDPSWLTAAASAPDVDIEYCLPAYAPQRKAVKGLSADKRGDFLRLFRLQGTPPGTAADGSLVYLKTEQSSDDQLHILLSFKRAVPLGSVVLGAPQPKGTVVKLSVLKPSAPYPPNVHDASQWTTLPTPTTPYWDVVPAPEGTETRALRLTFAHGSAAADGDDPLGNLLEQSAKRDVPRDPLDPVSSSKPKSSLNVSQGEWQGVAEGVKLLRRRFESRLPQATVRFNSGRLIGNMWDAERSEPLTTTNPGIYALEWKEPQSLHGLAIREIDGKLTKIDVYEGPATGPIDIAADDGWREVAVYEQARRYWYQPDANRNIDARFLDGYVDFGGEVQTRAVRLRIVEQWADNGQGRPSGAREDLGGLSIEPARCRVFGVAPLAYLGGEVPVESGLSERIEIYTAADGKLQSEIAIAQPGMIAYDPQGVLHAISGKQIVRVDPTGKNHTPVVSGLERPSDFAFDAAGKMYVMDRGIGDGKSGGLFVYDAAGQRIATIGEGVGFQAGPWNPQRFGAVTDLEIDSRGQLWAVEGQFYPKRVTVWSKEGKFLREHLGNTEYGGGGVLDPQDRTRLFIGPLEFELDWDRGTSRLKNMTWTGATPPGEVPIRIGKHTYLVTRPRFADMPCGIVYLYEAGRLKLAAAAGQAAGFEPLKRPEVLAKIGNQSLPERRFYWSDRNGDGEVQAEEVVLTVDEKPMPVTPFSPDLGLQAGPTRYAVKEILSNGVPVYGEESYPKLAVVPHMRLTDGNFYRMGDGRLREALLTSQGETIWSHAALGRTVQSLYSAASWTPDQVVAQFGLIGRLGPTGSPIGEMLVFHGNTGAWNVWTTDGLLIGPIFHDQRDGVARPWSMREHTRGMTLENIFPGQEHFHGHACLSEDGKFRIVAGHNHVSVLEVVGFDRAVRYQGEIEVSADDIRQTQAWEQDRQREDVYTRSPVLDVYLARKPPKIDGDLGDWQTEPAARMGTDKGPHAEFYATYDDQNLYLAYDVSSFGPLKNTGSEFQRLFQTGASVDLQIGVDPAAPEDRDAPVVGDVRLLLTFAGREPRAVLYRPIVPNTPEADVYRVVSPVGEVAFDRIDLIPGAVLARAGSDSRYQLEAAVPLATLGLKPAPGMRLKLDWGLLVSGPDGNEVIRRVYWSNQATNIVADAPSEARLHPNLWGHVLFHDKRKSAEDRLEALEKPPAPKGLDDLLDNKKASLP
jgi:hypothetical protein